RGRGRRRWAALACTVAALWWPGVPLRGHLPALRRYLRAGLLPGVALGRWWRRNLATWGWWCLTTLRRGRHRAAGLLPGRRGRHRAALRRRRGLSSLGRRRHLPTGLLARVPLRRWGRNLPARLLSRWWHLATLRWRRRSLATLRRRWRSLSTLRRRRGFLTAGLLPGRRR